MYEYMRFVLVYEYVRQNSREAQVEPVM